MMGMEYQKMHACLNDGILYRKEFESLHKCPRCVVSQYKMKDNDSEKDYVRKGHPAKVLWYLPIIPQFKLLSTNVNDAKKLTWYAIGKKNLMDCYDMMPIHRNGRKSILCILSLRVIQEILDLFLLQMI